MALVDELAHTNVPESRHPKRYQDVEELIEAGIDVYTTLNVQHIESLRNIVMQISGVWMQEAVPDSVIDKAAEIELVDLPPDELLKRLKEGKVYVPDEAARAAAGFFREGNLIALRELTMRTAAVRVDDRLRAYMQAHAIRGPWPAAERILVCISPNAQSARLVRTARMLASQLYAEWFAVYVETPNDVRLSPEERNRVLDNLRLAERMGAKTVTIRGDSVAAAVTEYAAKNHITKIVVGKTQSRWRKLFGMAAVDQVIRQSKQVDVIVATAEEKPVKQERAPAGMPYIDWRAYLPALLLDSSRHAAGLRRAQLLQPRQYHHDLPALRRCHSGLLGVWPVCSGLHPECSAVGFLLCQTSSDLCGGGYPVHLRLHHVASGWSDNQLSDHTDSPADRGRPEPRIRDSHSCML